MAQSFGQFFLPAQCSDHYLGFEPTFKVSKILFTYFQSKPCQAKKKLKGSACCNSVIHL